MLLRTCGSHRLDQRSLRGEGEARDPPGWEPGVVLVQLAMAIALDAQGMSDIRLLAHQTAVFGVPPSDSTVRRTLAPFEQRMLATVAKARNPQGCELSVNPGQRDVACP